jgi:urease accessory protein
MANSRAGEARLHVGHVAGRSAVVSSQARSPLRLLTPRARGESVWAYTSSFGGGMVAGDCTRLNVTVDAGARCFLSTQASTKIYRNPASLPCSHETHATVREDALLILAPDPVQCFADSSYEQRQHFTLAEAANLLLVDWFSAGRTARGERWSFRRYVSRNEVRRAEESESDRELQRAVPPHPDLLPRGEGVTSSSALTESGALVGTRQDSEVVEGAQTTPEVGERFSLSPRERAGVRGKEAQLNPRSQVRKPASAKTLLLDALRLDREDGALESKYRGGALNCFATVVLLGPKLAGHARAILDWCSAQPIAPGASLVFAASPLHEGAILRFTGTSVEEVGRAIHQRISFVGELLDDDPWKRKW